MNYRVEVSDNFRREAKRLVKKYPSLKTELADLFKNLETNPRMGTPLGHEIYKIRLSIASKNKGKSGGARALSFVNINQNSVLLFAIYSKGETDSLSDKQIKELIKDYL